MKRILLLFFLFVAINAKAGDTLTRAQVYNFSVGDTFDYRYFASTTQTDWNGHSITQVSTTYSRKLIKDISYSLDSSTKFIKEERIFPYPSTFDTLIMQNLYWCEAYLDSGGCPSYAETIIVNSNSNYNGRVSNTLLLPECNPYNLQTQVFTEGLGLVLSVHFGGVQITAWNDTTELIYYSKNTEIWGTPYYDFPSGVLQLTSSTDKITLFPTLNNGTFNVKMTDTNMLPINLAIYDITGQKLEQSSLNNLSTEVSIGPHSAGVYIWKAFSSNQLIQTGKLVIR